MNIAAAKIERNERFESVWAWIELYEKQEGEWKRIGNVSNRKPPSAE